MSMLCMGTVQWWASSITLYVAQNCGTYKTNVYGNVTHRTQPCVRTNATTAINQSETETQLGWMEMETWALPRWSQHSIFFFHIIVHCAQWPASLIRHAYMLVPDTTTTTIDAAESGILFRTTRIPAQGICRAIKCNGTHTVAPSTMYEHFNILAECSACAIRTAWDDIIGTNRKGQGVWLYRFRFVVDV